MNSKAIRNLILVIAGLTLLWAVNFYWQNLRGIGPTISKPNQDISEVIPKPGENKTGMPLKLPDGFSIEIFAKDLSGARVLKFNGTDLFVSRTSDGKISIVHLEGQSVKILEGLGGLRKPHGFAFDPDDESTIYIAEEHQITKRVLSDGSPVKIADLPTQGGGHFTRTLEFGPDGRLYVSIGSSCNVCNEGDLRRAAIYSMKPDGSDFKLFAKGLRNTVFFTWNTDGKMWGTDMGRDLLGDNIPPDEINQILEGRDYGWPNCYGNNVPDPFSPTCENKTPAQVDLQAHSAPLGLAFVPHDSNWPKEYWGDLIVAFHGSWNRSIPTGYKLVRIKLDENGKSEGIEDFLTGWLQGSSALGRPVDVKFHGDALYVSDDKAGVIYRIIY